MNRCFKILNVFLLIIFFNQRLFAQNKLTVEQAIAATIENNFDIQLLRNDSSSYALDKSYARAAFLPRVNATTGLYLTTTIKNKNWPMEVKDKAVVSSQIIFRGQFN